MTEEVETKDTEIKPEDKTPAEAQKADKSEAGGEEPIMIPKDRFDEVLQERNRLRQEREELERAAKEREKQELEKQGEYRQLYEQKAKEAEEFQALLEQQKIDALKRDIATEAGFPQLWNRISGTDEASLKDDMEALLGNLPKPVAPNIDGSTGRKSRSTEEPTATMSKERREYWAGILDVPVKDLPKNIVID